jgi:hypothetical protein
LGEGRGKWHLGLFERVYLVIIAQLALFGPVIVGLLGRVPRSKAIGPIAIVLPLLMGYGLAYFGAGDGDNDLVNGASMITLFLSIAIAYFGSRSSKTKEI